MYVFQDNKGSVWVSLMKTWIVYKIYIFIKINYFLKKERCYNHKY